MELGSYNNLAQNRKCTFFPPKSLLHPKAGVDVHPYLATGTASAKFGVPMGQLVQVLAQLATSSLLTIVGRQRIRIGQKGQGRSCCLADVLEYRTNHLAARI